MGVTHSLVNERIYAVVFCRIQADDCVRMKLPVILYCITNQFRSQGRLSILLNQLTPFPYLLNFSLAKYNIIPPSLIRSSEESLKEVLVNRKDDVIEVCCDVSKGVGDG